MLALSLLRVARLLRLYRLIKVGTALRAYPRVHVLSRVIIPAFNLPQFYALALGCTL